MKKVMFALFSLVATLTFAQAPVKADPNTWTLDKSHANVKFTVTHMVISEVEGTFKVYDGTIVSSKPDFTDAKIDFSVDVASINTENEGRDKHLRSDDFFNAEKFPKMTFKSTSFKKTGDKTYVLEGDLTIRDVTKRVKFDVVYGGQAVAWGKTKAGFKASGSINRTEYGLKWNSLTEAGGMVVSEDVAINLNLEFEKGK